MSSDDRTQYYKDHISRLIRLDPERRLANRGLIIALKKKFHIDDSCMPTEMRERYIISTLEKEGQLEQASEFLDRYRDMDIHAQSDGGLHYKR